MQGIFMLYLKPNNSLVLRNGTILDGLIFYVTSTHLWQQETIYTVQDIPYLLKSTILWRDVLCDVSLGI